MSENLWLAAYVLSLTLSINFGSKWDWSKVVGLRQRAFRFIVHLPSTLLVSVMVLMLMTVVVDVVTFGALFAAGPSVPMSIFVAATLLASLFLGHVIACDLMSAAHKFRSHYR